MTAQVPHETIAFAAGQCVGYFEDFDDGQGNGGAGAYICELTITAPAFELRAGGPAAPLAPVAARQWAERVSETPTPGLGSSSLAAALPSPPEYTLDEFKKTIWGADQVAPAVVEQLYTHFTAAKASADPAPHWAAMENLVRTTTYVNKAGLTEVLNGGWPPANGGVNKRPVQPAPPDKFDRYQKKVRADGEGLPVLEGTFTSPIPKGGAFNYEARALEGEESDYDLMYEIEVLKPLPFSGEEADIIPWHGHAGNGIQTKMLFPPRDPATGDFPWDWQKLEEKEYIRVIYKSSPSGKFEILPGNQARLKQ